MANLPGFKALTLVTLLTLTLAHVLFADPISSTESSSQRRSSSGSAGAKRKGSRTLRRYSRGVSIEKISPCSALVDGRLINLSPLGDTTFKPGLVTEVGGWTYSFNPCFPFNVPEDPYTALEDQCDFVAMCKSKKRGDDHVAYTLGIQQTTIFQMQPLLSDSDASFLIEPSSPGELSKTGYEETTAEIYIDSDVNGQPEGGYERANKHSEGKDEREEEELGEGELEEVEAEEDEGVTNAQVEKRRQKVQIMEDVREEGSGDNPGPLDDLENGEEDGEYETEESGDDDDDDDDEQDDDEEEEDDDDDAEEEERVVHVGDSDGEHIGEAGQVPPSVRPPRKTKRQFRNKGRKGRTPIGTFERRQRREVTETPSILGETGDKIKQRKSRRRQKAKVGLQTSERRNKGMELALKLTGIRRLRRQRTYIYLVCDTKGIQTKRANFSFLGMKHSKMFFELRHLCCCPDACTNNVVRLGASHDGRSEEVSEVDGSKLWPPHQLLWAVVAVFLIIVMAIVIGTACCRTGEARGPYTMLPGIHSSRLTMSSMESVRMSNNQKFPSPDYLDYTSPKFKQAQYPQFENGIVPASELEIGQRLGGGLFGDTYLGYLGDRNVSAKRITVGVHKGQMTDADRAWLADVINNLMKLQHKNVVTVLGICLDLRQPHVIKEFIDGTSLKDLLVNTDDGSLTYIRKIRMLAQVAEGLQYLHSTRYMILHRDLRCANLLVSKYDDQVKITDFGMVQVLHRLRIQCTGREGCYCRKSTPAFPASIRWTAPEILRHPTSDETTSSIYSPACDVFSFGMTIWEAMHIADPWFDIVEEENVIDMVLRGGRPDPTPLEGVPDAHVSLMKACWIETPEKRPSSKQILSHLGIVMKQLSKGERKKERRDSESSTMNYFRSALNLASS